MDLSYLNNKSVVIGVSGGVDSMVLLNEVMKTTATVFVVYINHHARARAIVEENYLIKFCSDNKLVLERFDYFHKVGNFEAGARVFRYERFQEVYAKYACDYLLTAHHGDDLIETMLMRILRGSDLNGYGGFRSESFNYGMNISRPLIKYSKAFLKTYAYDQDIVYFEDESNQNLELQRNYLRHKVIKQLHGDYVHKFKQLSDELYNLSDYVSDVVEEAIIVYDDIYLKQTIDSRLLYYGIKKCLSYLYVDNIHLVDNKHVILIEHLENKATLPMNYLVYLNNEHYVFTKQLTNTYEYVINDDLEVEFLNSVLSFKEHTHTLYLREDVVFPLRVKNANLDDKIELKNGSQQLNRVFINAKVLRHKRSSWPVIVDGLDRVICVVGLKYSIYCVNHSTSSKFMVQYSCIFKGDDFNA